VQLCFLVPGGAVAVMPAAVAGATHLARHVIDGVDAQVFPELATATHDQPATPA
jgi:CysZ protein